MRHAGNRTSAIRFLLIKNNFEHPTILYVFVYQIHILQINVYVVRIILFECLNARI